MTPNTGTATALQNGNTVAVPVLVWVLLVLAGAAVGATPREMIEVTDPWSPVAGGSEHLPVELQLDWRHPGLELWLWSLHEERQHVELRFCLRLLPHSDAAWTTLGYPRYRTTYRWNDAVTMGSIRRSRVIGASRDDGSDRGFFSVRVPRDATELRLPIGQDEVFVDLPDWFARLDIARSEGRLAGVEAPSPPPPIGSPVRLHASLRWEGERPFGDGALDAGESGDLLVDVFNDGARTATGVRVRVTSVEPAEVDFPAEIPVDEIEAGRTSTVRIPFRAGERLEDRTLQLRIDVLEPWGHDARPLTLEVVARAAPTSRLVLLEDFAVEGARLPVPRDAVVTVRLRLRNMGQGVAEQVIAGIRPGGGVYLASDGPADFDLGDVAPGEVVELTYRCYANQRAESLELTVDFSDERSRSHPESSVVTLPLEDSGLRPTIVSVRAERAKTVPLAAAPRPLTSDIDLDVPRSQIRRPEALAVVLGAERYQTAPVALHAAEDARTAARYFELVLGVPPERIELHVDHELTLGTFARLFDDDGWLSRRAGPETDVFVFFAGHGLSSADGGAAYLMPIDAEPNYFRQTGYPVDTMMESLVALDARTVTVFLDSCFSGLTRDGASIVTGARPLLVVPDRDRPPGVSIFSAASGTQMANALDEKGHGLFTYLLFRGLGGGADFDGDRRIVARELKSYLDDLVPRAASLIDREQDPGIVLDDEEWLLTELP